MTKDKDKIIKEEDEQECQEKEKEQKQQFSSEHKKEDEENDASQAQRTLEERRRSMLDHHWAVPSKDRLSFSVDDEQQDSLNSEKVKILEFFKIAKIEGRIV